MRSGEEDLLTTMEVAAIFRVTRATITGWARKGLLPYTLTPTGRLRFYRADIERLLRKRRSSEGGISEG